jgi:creatinine amidohydrolase
MFVPDGDHANDMETSAMLSIAPELVQMEDADDGAWQKSRFKGVREGWVSVSRPWHLLTKSSGVGTPYEATAEKGERFFEVVIENLAGFIKELSDAKMDETFPF